MDDGNSEKLGANIQNEDSQRICEHLDYNATLQDQLQNYAFNNRFEIEPSQLKTIKVLGQGYFGDVSLGILTKDYAKLLVAVKTPKNMNNHNPEDNVEREELLQKQRESLKDELKIMHFIGLHNNVLKLLGAITTKKDYFCVITEYCELGSLDIFLRTKIEKEFYCDEIVKKTEQFGEDIAENTTYWKAHQDTNWSDGFHIRRNNGQITTSDLLWLGLQIARAMDFLTKKRVLHRDVALRNVLLKTNLIVKVADFGLSRFANNDGLYCALHNLVLPYRYIAPESLLTGRFSSESERWAFGVVVWEIFTFAMRMPYQEECDNSNDDQVILSYLQSGGRLSVPDTAPLSMLHLMHQLWNTEPSTRPSFQACEQVLVNELMQACPEILRETEENTLPSHHEDITNRLQADKHVARTKNWKLKMALIICAVIVLIALCGGIAISRLSFISDELQIAEKDFVHHFIGVPGALFCVHPNGKSVFTFDGYNFLQFNLSTGKYSSLKQVQLPLIIRRPRRTGIVHSDSMHAIAHQSKTFILVLYLDEDTTKLHLASYFIHNMSVAIVSNQELGVNQSKSVNFNYYALANSLIQDNSTGQLYCILYWNGFFTNAPSVPMTFFRAVRIDIDYWGRIWPEIIVSEKTLEGRWMYPFVLSHSLFFLDAIEIRRQKMLRVSLEGNDTTVLERNVKLLTIHEEWPQWSTVSFTPLFPAVADDFIFYTADPTSEPGSLVLVYLDWKQKFWRSITVPMDVTGNFLALTKSGTSLEADMRSTSDGRLVFHGHSCTSVSPCAEKMYFFIIDIRRMVSSAQFRP